MDVPKESLNMTPENLSKIGVARDTWRR